MVSAEIIWYGELAMWALLFSSSTQDNNKKYLLSICYEQSAMS